MALVDQIQVHVNEQWIEDCAKFRLKILHMYKLIQGVWPVNSHLLSSSFDRHMRVEKNSRANSRFSTLIYSHPRLTGAWELKELSRKLSLLNSHLLSSSFDWRMRVQRTLVQTLASELSSTLILVWLAHDSWENSRANSRFSTLIYSHPNLTRP